MKTALIIMLATALLMPAALAATEAQEFVVSVQADQSPRDQASDTVIRAGQGVVTLVADGDRNQPPAALSLPEAIRRSLQAQTDRGHNAAENLAQAYRGIVNVYGLEKAAFLGLSTSPLTPALREQLGLPKGIGLLIESVAKGSPAEAGGLKPYDVLHKLGDQLVVNPQQLAVLIRMHKSGELVTLTIIRQGKPVDVTVKLTEKDVVPIDDDNVLGLFEMPLPRNVVIRREMNVSPQTPKGPGPSIDADAGSLSVVWTDEHYTTRFTTKDGKDKHLTVTDRSGKEIFSGPIETPEQRKELPPDVLRRLEQIERSMEGTKPAENK